MNDVRNSIVIVPCFCLVVSSQTEDNFVVLCLLFFPCKHGRWKRGRSPLDFKVQYLIFTFSLTFGVDKMKFHRCWLPLKEILFATPGKIYYRPSLEKNRSDGNVCKTFKKLFFFRSSFGGCSPYTSTHVPKRCGEPFHANLKPSTRNVLEHSGTKCHFWFVRSKLVFVHW